MISLIENTQKSVNYLYLFDINILRYEKNFFGSDTKLIKTLNGTDKKMISYIGSMADIYNIKQSFHQIAKFGVLYIVQNRFLTKFLK